MVVSSKSAMYPFNISRSIVYHIAVLVLLKSLDAVLCGEHEKRLHKDLMEGYNRMTRPVINESDPVPVTLGLTMQQIIDVDEINQIIETNIWLNFKWVDQHLRWDPREYGGIKEIRLAPEDIWVPDILLYNSVDESFNTVYQAHIVVRHNGTMEWLPPGIVKSECRINIAWFPFDDQNCTLKFGSWTYGGGFLDLQLGSIDQSTYVPNGEWKLMSVLANRNKHMYDCCPDPYLDVTFKIWIRRRTLYYGFNLIIPCLLIALMALLDFILPPDSGEKLTLGITIFMSLCVFLLMVAEAMPPTSDAVPLIGVYFSTVMIIVSASQAFTVLVLNFHYRNPDFHEMPTIIRKIFLNWLPCVLMMSKPDGMKTGDENTKEESESLLSSSSKPYAPDIGPNFNNSISLRHFSNSSSNYHNSDSHRYPTSLPSSFHEDLSLAATLPASPLPTNHVGMGNHNNVQNNVSAGPLASPQTQPPRSLLANVLDMDDDTVRRIRWYNTGLASSAAAANATNAINGPRVGVAHAGIHHSSRSGGAGALSPHCGGGEAYPYQFGGDIPPYIIQGLSNLEMILNGIHRELKLITKRIREDDEEAELERDWKFAAMVLDRLCLILFTTIFVVATCAIIFSAPQLVV